MRQKFECILKAALYTAMLFFSISLSKGSSSNSVSNSAKLDKALQEAHTEEVAWKYVPLSGPAVDPEYSANVSTQIGKTALLNCRIKYGGGKTVSWMRTRDLHLLTVGRFTYTSDERFKALHQSGSHDWMLKIHYVQKRDQGGYECQVSTNPPLSYTVWLQVVEPETRILGARDLHIHAGSNINLTCVVRHSPEAPAYMLWYHGKELLSYDSPRGGITVVTESSTSTTSRLLIQRATPSDAGRYTCTPAKADSFFVNVHVVPSEHPAAIHHKNGTSSSGWSSGSSKTSRLALPIVLLLLNFFMYPVVRNDLLLGPGRCPRTLATLDTPVPSDDQVSETSALPRQEQKAALNRCRVRLEIPKSTCKENLTKITRKMKLSLVKKAGNFSPRKIHSKRNDGSLNADREIEVDLYCSTDDIGHHEVMIHRFIQLRKLALNVRKKEICSRRFCLLNDLRLKNEFGTNNTSGRNFSHNVFTANTFYHSGKILPSQSFNPGLAQA